MTSPQTVPHPGTSLERRDAARVRVPGRADLFRYVAHVAGYLAVVVLCLVMFGLGHPSHTPGPEALRVEFIDSAPSGDDGAWYALIVPTDAPTGGPASVTGFSARHSYDAEMIDAARTARAVGAAFTHTASDLGAKRPVPPEMWTGGASGPSAGLAFTLATIDRHTPGRLAGPLVVAATGTVDRYGNVGPVGGVAEKYRAARAAGADVLFVPSGQRDAVTEVPDGPVVIEVRSVTEAVSVLCAAAQPIACQVVATGA